MADTTILGISRTATLSPGETVETQHSTNGSGKLDLLELFKAFTSRAVADSLLSDGATSNRAFYAALPFSLAAQIVTFRFEGYIPSSNPSAEITLLSLSSATNPYVSNSIRLTCFTNGTFFLVQEGAIFNTDKRVLMWTGGRTAYSGQWIRGCIAFNTADSTTNPTVEINGVDVTANFTLSTAGTPPNWMPATLVSTYYLAGYNAPAGRFIPHAPVLGTTTKAERDQWVITGIGPDWWQYAAGTLTPIISPTVNNGGFETAGSPLGTWATSTNAGGAVTRDTTEFYSGTASCKLSIPVASGAYAVVYIPQSSGIVGAGKKHYLEFWAKTDATGASLSIQDTVTSANLTAPITLTTTWTKYSFEFISANGTFKFSISSSTTAMVAYVDAVTSFVEGPIARWVIQPCRVVDDAGANGIPGILASGITPLTPRKEWRIRTALDMTTTGNKQLLGAALLDTPQSQALDSIDVECAGTPTFSIGDGTTATKYSASTAFTAGRTRLIPAAYYPADSAKTGIYANVTVAGGAPATAEKITLRGHRTD